MDWLIGLAVASLEFIFPAYVANASPVLFTGKRTIDGGRKWGDGKPLLGKGKTWKGLFAGITFGTLTALLMALWLHPASLAHYAALGLIMSIGALTGDIVKSFFKRRLGYRRGEMFPFFDQTDFVFGAFAFTAPFAFPGWDVFLFLLVVTPGIHLVTNIISYVLGQKSVPW